MAARTIFSGSDNVPPLMHKTAGVPMTGGGLPTHA
jgi:hypothetical protein